MKAPLSRLAAGTGVAACLAASVGCYPAYPPGNPYASGYSQGAKGYEVPYGPAPAQQQPAHYGVDPGVVIAGAAALGLIGYAIGSHHDHDYYGGYYAPVPYHYGHGHHGGHWHH